MCVEKIYFSLQVTVHYTLMPRQELRQRLPRNVTHWLAPSVLLRKLSCLAQVHLTQGKYHLKWAILLYTDWQSRNIPTNYTQENMAEAFLK